MLVAKFCDHLSLYRQSEICARGRGLKRSTLADQVGQSAALLRPPVDALKRHAMTGGLFARRAAVRRDSRAAVRYRYTADHRGEHPRARVAGFGGVLQADGYAGSNELYGTGCVAEAACRAHVRRKFHDIHAAGRSPMAQKALTRIAALYAIEASITRKPPDRRRHARQAEAAPLLDNLRSWLEITLTKVHGRGEVAVAIRYALTRWTALTRYVDHSAIPIDDKPVERAITPVASEERIGCSPVRTQAASGPPPSTALSSWPS